MNDIQLRELFEAARQAGLTRYAGNKSMERKRPQGRHRRAQSVTFGCWKNSNPVTGAG